MAKTYNILQAARKELKPEKYYGPLAFPEGSVTVLAGEGSAGKTFLALHLMIELSAEGYNCAFFTFEDSTNRLAKRLSFLARKFLVAHPEVKNKESKIGNITLIDALDYEVEDFWLTLRNVIGENRFVFIDPLIAVVENTSDTTKVQRVVRHLSHLASVRRRNIILIHRTSTGKIPGNPMWQSCGARQIYVIERISPEERLDLYSVRPKLKERVGSVHCLFAPEPVMIICEPPKEEFPEVKPIKADTDIKPFEIEPSPLQED